MICKNCGTDNQDEVSFCTSCGEALEQEPEKKEEKPSKQSFFNKKTMYIISAGAALVLVLLLVFTLLFGNEAENTVDELYEAVVSYDYDAVVSLLPPAVVDSLKERLAVGETEMEIMDSKELSPVYIAEIDEAYQKKFATNKGYIEDAAIVYIEAKWKGEVLTRDRISVYMVQIGGEWYFDPLTTFEDFPFEELPDID
ncbi:MAG: zinc ribbon domain-containing protein [Oscillospiraceae bacterium]|nr:zinc ribbon domain-containing protein [Oscillospiraceae bacterium]